MVLARRIGVKRSFGLGLLLTIVTFGIYAVYWNYKAHNELYRQYELGREGRDEGMVWYVLGLVLPPFLLAYIWVFAANVAYLRERVGLPRTTTPGRLVSLVGLGVGIFAAGIIFLQAAIVTSGAEPTREELDAAVDAAGAAFLASAVAGGIVLAAAYQRLQRDINELWDALDARLAWLRLHPEELRRAEVAALAPMADAASLAAPLRAELESLRARHPTLRALAPLGALAARAEAGDAGAREEAERLLGDVAGLLVERAELLRRREELDAAERLELLEQALFEAPSSDGAAQA